MAAALETRCESTSLLSKPFPSTLVTLPGNFTTPFEWRLRQIEE
jgi:hypothetical protein